MDNSVTVRFDGQVTRTALARAKALDLAAGNKRLLREQPDGSVLVVNHPDFDTRAWTRPAKARKGKRNA